MATDYQQIEKALKYIEKNTHRQPELDELARAVGVSPFHLQRTFKRWAGISPKRFLQFLTLEQAKALLDRDSSVLDATFEVGMSSPGRLHDLFVNLEAVTPGEYKQQGEGLEIRYGIHSSPFGYCLLAVTDRGICGLTFHDTEDVREGLDRLDKYWPRAKIQFDPAMTIPYHDRIFREAGPVGREPIHLLVRGTNFQVKVWEALIRVPAGEFRSYGTLARESGYPAAVRAVGSAVGANPIGYLIPCHRVIRKMGVFGNYRWGAVRKKAIIGWELARAEKVISGQ